MSREAAFSPLDFPSLPTAGGDTRENIRGHAAGYAAGRKQVEAELAALREAIELDGERRRERDRTEVQRALDALVRSAAEFRARELPTLRSVDAAIAAAAIELAEAIVGRELSRADDSARAALERAMHDTAPAGSAVRLNPHDIAVIEASGAPTADLELVPDATIARGDAIVQTVDGSIDARVSSSIARARAALLDGSS